MRVNDINPQKSKIDLLIMSYVRKSNVEPTVLHGKLENKTTFRTSVFDWKLT